MLSIFAAFGINLNEYCSVLMRFCPNPHYGLFLLLLYFECQVMAAFSKLIAGCCLLPGGHIDIVSLTPGLHACPLVFWLLCQALSTVHQLSVSSRGTYHLVNS
jgi:hypothetical protein